MRFYLYPSSSAHSACSIISGHAAAQSCAYFSSRRAGGTNTRRSNPTFSITALRLLLTSTLGLLLSFSTLAQENYNAGVGSGTGGTYTVMVGPYAGAANTGGSNSFLGYNAGLNNTTGNNNNFLGFSAGYSNTTGSNNNFVGLSAGYSNTTGSYNSFLGHLAGFSNKTGYQNSFLGSYAGFSGTTGYSNSFLGFSAGYSNTTGYQNSFVGVYAGFSNVNGNSNSFLGYQSGYNNLGGSNNSFMGNFAGYSNTIGQDNAFIGFKAGYYNTNGSFNVFVGVQAGQSATTADNNSFIGYQSGFKTTTGYDNAFLGTKSGYQNTTGYYNFFLGKQAGFNNTSGANNAYLGNAAGYLNQTGSSNVAIGTFAGYHNIGGNNVFIGFNSFSPSGVTLTNAIAIGSKSYVSASNSMVLGSINGVNGAAASTNVGIGTSAPAYRLQLGENSAAKPGTSTWTIASDRRLKKNISTFSEGIEVLTKIKPVWFQYNGEAGMPTDKKYVGIIAQEMQKIAPYTVGQFTYQDTTGKATDYLDYDANALTYIMVNSVKEQQGQIEELQQVVQQKDTQIADLTNRLMQLETAVGKLTGEPLKATDTPAQLYQNFPNPTEGTTVIGYFLPQEATSAQLKVYSVTGVEVQSIELKGRGKGQVRLSVKQLAAGQYIYHLLVDGQSVASKHLLLNR